MIRIKELRGRKGWTQKDLSDASGVAQSAISDLESGMRDSRYATLEKVAKALGVTVPELYDKEGVKQA